MLTNLPFLSILIWLPIISASFLLLFNRCASKCYLRGLALFTSILSLSICVYLLYCFDYHSSAFQWRELHPWLPLFDIQYALGIDGFSLALITLTVFMTFLVMLSETTSTIKYSAQYQAAFLMLQGFLCGAFSAMDSILFYLFWEAILIPMFLIIGIWGGVNRKYAAFKFFLYTFLGSIFLLVAVIYLHHVAKRAGVDSNVSFLISTFHTLPLDLHTQKWIFWALLISFAVKVPMWPVHTWLPDAHVEAPTEGSVILAAILLKLGVYGFLRFLLPITPDASQYYAEFLIALSLIAIIYIGFVAIAQTDIKKLIAYSSISHMGFATLGCFSYFHVEKSKAIQTALLGIEGTLAQLISHGFISGALFFSVGVLYSRLHTRDIKQYGGIAKVMPVFATLFMLFTLANTGLPGTSGFVGELLILLATFSAHPLYAILGALTLILSAIYMLRLYKETIFGEVIHKNIALLKDVTKRERAILGCLGILIILFGVWPKPLFKVVHATSENLTKQVVGSKIKNSKGKL